MRAWDFACIIRSEFLFRLGLDIRAHLMGLRTWHYDDAVLRLSAACSSSPMGPKEGCASGKDITSVASYGPFGLLHNLHATFPLATKARTCVCVSFSLATKMVWPDLSFERPKSAAIH